MSSPGFATSSLLVAIGGATGSWFRFAIGRLLGPRTLAFPWSTLTVNLLGSLAMGLLAGWLARHSSGGEAWRLLLGVGLLGGFTTFSAFSLEIVGLVERGALVLAAGYIAVSLAGGIAGLSLGLALARNAA